MNYRFRPATLPTLATILLVALFIRLGFWQLHKAEAKQALQAQLDRHIQETPIALPPQIDDLEAWRYRRVTLTGTYDAQYQILLDNQVEKDMAGYHVITPLRVAGSDAYVLIDRGWIAAPAEHRIVPAVATPSGTQEVIGSVWLPSSKIFALEAPPADGKWQPVWQNLNMQRYAKIVPFKIQPLIVRLDAGSPAGGFVRDWPRPAERIEMHLGYAYQWFGFAATLVVIYFVINFRKAEH